MKIAERTRPFLEGIYSLMSKQPLLFLAVILALQTGFLLESRALWFSDEIRYANVFYNLLDGKWLVLYLNGEFYPDKPPIFFWMLWLVRQATGLEGAPLFFMGAAISGFFYLAATLWLTRLLDLSKELRFGVGALLLTTFYFVGLTHYVRMDLLFASLIIASEVCFFKAWKREVAFGWTTAGFFLAAVAVITKGPLGIVLPLVGSVAYLWWTRNLRRLRRIDVWRGVLVALGLLLLWVAGTLIIEGRPYLDNILYEQVYRRAVNTWHHEQPFYHYFLTFPAAFLPWTLALLVLPLRRLFSRDFWQRVRVTRGLREGAEDGLVYCWCVFLAGFATLSAVSIKIVVYLLPLFAPLAVITAHWLLHVAEKQSARLFGGIALVLGLLGAVLPFANLLHPWPITIKGVVLCGLLLLALAFLLWQAVPRTSPKASLVALVIAVILWIQPVGLILAPSLDAIMSPKAQAEVLAAYADKGYDVMAYKMYSGTYTYYAGQNIHEIADWDEMLAELGSHDKVALAMRRKYWDQWENRPADLQVVHEQWIADRPFVVIVKGGAADTSGGAPDATE